jgi:hypothetical protein
MDLSDHARPGAAAQPAPPAPPSPAPVPPPPPPYVQVNLVRCAQRPPRAAPAPSLRLEHPLLARSRRAACASAGAGAARAAPRIAALKLSLGSR